jgi:hypothetical protein
MWSTRRLQVTLLGQEGTITEGSLEGAKRTIQALIGFFDLDPNRVLDLAMDSLEINPNYLILLKIISVFNVVRIVKPHLAQKLLSIGHRRRTCRIGKTDVVQHPNAVCLLKSTSILSELLSD